jgi:sugar lactone lactonase YvrE
VLSTLAYTATGPGGGLKNPSGVSALNGTVWVSDTAANVVAAVQGGTTTAVAGSLTAFGPHGDGGPATSASLYQPGGTAEDAKGDVFIADSGDSTVREVTASGVIRTVAGTGRLRSLDRPQDVAVNARGDVLIADTAANKVVEVTPAGLVLPVAGLGAAGYGGDHGPAILARLDEPAGIAVDAAGNLFIADSGNNVIRRVDARTGIITTVAGNVAADAASDGLGGFAGDGGPATAARLNDPQGVAVDGAGDLFIADTFNNAVREVTPAGTITTVVNAAGASGAPPPAGAETSGGAPAASKLNTPYAVAIDPATGVLYIADTHNNKVAAVTGLAQAAPATSPGASASPSGSSSASASPSGSASPGSSGSAAAPAQP